MISVFLVQNVDNMKKLLLQLEKIQYLREQLKIYDERQTLGAFTTESSDSNRDISLEQLFAEIDRDIGIQESTINFANLSYQDILYCLDRYKVVLNERAVDTLNLDIEHKIGHVCVAAITLKSMMHAKYCIVTYDEKIFMRGVFLNMSYNAEQNCYVLRYEAKHNVNHEQIIDRMKKHLYGKKFIKDINKFQLSNVIIDRCDDKIYMLDRNVRDFKEIDSFYPDTLQIMQMRPAADRIACRFHVYWDCIKQKSYRLKRTIKNATVDKNTRESYLPKVNDKYGNTTIKHIDIKYRDIVADADQYHYTIDLMLNVDREYIFRIDEVCEATMHLQVADHIVKTELQIADIYCDVSEEISCLKYINKLTEWQADKEYVIGDIVTRHGYTYSCIQVTKDAEFNEEYWHMLDLIANDEKDNANDGQNSIHIAFANKNMSILPKTLYILEQLAEYYLYVFRVSMQMPLTAKNMHIKIGDCIKMDRFNSADIGQIGYVESVRIVLSDINSYMHIDIAVQAPLKRFDLNNLDDITERHGLLRYNKFDRQEMIARMETKIRYLTRDLKDMENDDAEPIEECIIPDSNYSITHPIILDVYYDA